MSSHNLSKASPKLLLAKGKVIKGPTVNAYSRCSIATIPSAVENVLFKKPKDLTSINYKLFEVQGDSIKLSFQNGILGKSPQLTANNSGIRLNKPQTHCIKPSERFHYNDQEKYYPGPTNYNPTHIPKSLRYNSLFESAIYQTEPFEAIPGPGSYNISSLFKANVYISPFSRFRKKREEEYKQKVGPGSYNVSYDLGSKDKDKLSPFFMKEAIIPKKNEDDIMKYVDSHNNIIDSIKDSNQCTDTNQFKKKEIKPKAKNFVDIKEEIIHKHLDSQLIIKDEDNSKDKSTIITKMNNNKTEDTKIDHKKIKGITINPISTSSKPLKRNIVPGPCYYDQPLRRKKIFNSNLNNNWIGQ